MELSLEGIWSDQSGIGRVMMEEIIKSQCTSGGAVGDDSKKKKTGERKNNNSSKEKKENDKSYATCLIS